MSARLTPAQRRVVDAMRGGAVLRVHSHNLTEQSWWLDDAPIGEHLARTLRRSDVIERAAMPMAPSTWRRYVLAPAYQGGEA